MRREKNGDHGDSRSPKNGFPALKREANSS